MDLGLKGKIALVTAATEGLGLATAARLAAEGCEVAICGRRRHVMDAALAEIERRGGRRALGVLADLTRPGEIEPIVDAVVKAFGRLDILVVNAGHIPYGGIEDLTDSQWYEAFELLLMSAVRLTRRAVPVMRANGAGEIVFLTSASAREPSPQLLLSNVMRLGVTGLAKTIARTLAPDSIRVNVVAPGYFDSGRVRRRLDGLMAEHGISRSEATARVAGDIPLGRAGAPEELADLVAFVVSRRVEMLTGATLTVDGGRSRSIL